MVADMISCDMGRTKALFSIDGQFYTAYKQVEGYWMVYDKFIIQRNKSGNGYVVTHKKRV